MIPHGCLPAWSRRSQVAELTQLVRWSWSQAHCQRVHGVMSAAYPNGKRRSSVSTPSEARSASPNPPCDSKCGARVWHQGLAHPSAATTKGGCSLFSERERVGVIDTTVKVYQPPHQAPYHRRPHNEISLATITIDTMVPYLLSPHVYLLLPPPTLLYHGTAADRLRYMGVWSKIYESSALLAR